MPPITLSSPKPFKVPHYDIRPIKEASSSTNLDAFYNSLLVGALDIPSTDFTYGLPPRTARALHERLVGEFDWDEWIAKIEGMGEHLQVDAHGVEGDGETARIHFVHRPSANADAVPLILLHGWPGSFLEFEAILPLLKDDYHVIVPSQTGYPFSSPQKTRKGGTSALPKWNISAFATCCHEIMKAMGYPRYVAQGGDTGHLVARRIAQLFPESCVAIHLNNAAHLGGLSGHDLAPNEKREDLSDVEKRGLERMEEFYSKGTAYSRMHGTVPYTVGAVLCTSPLAAVFWISEKIYRWSAPQTAPSLDFALATCLLYWFSGSIPSCLWHYYIILNHDDDVEEIFRTKIDQPAAIGIGPWDFGWPSKKAFENIFTNLRSWRILDEGGHFAAHEVPELLKEDFDKLFMSKAVLDALRRSG